MLGNLFNKAQNIGKSVLGQNIHGALSSISKMLMFFTPCGAYTVQYSSVYSTVQYSIVYSTVQYWLQYSTVQYCLYCVHDVYGLQAVHCLLMFCIYYIYSYIFILLWYSV